jgi:hypothetical protein
MAESWDFQSLYQTPAPAIPCCCDEVLTALMTWHCQYHKHINEKHILLIMNKFHYPIKNTMKTIVNIFTAEKTSNLRKTELFLTILNRK